MAHDAVSQDHLRRYSPSCLCIKRSLSAFLHRYGSNTSITCCEGGLAQGIAVSANTTITGFSFWITSPAQNLKFFIFDRGTNTKIYESQKSVGIIASGTSGGTDPFSLLLVGGKSYDFGIVDATSTTTRSLSPAATLTQNWLSLDGGFAVCDGYTNPSFSYRISYISRALRIDSNLTQVPEPSTYVMFGTGLFGVFGLARRRTVA
ncbi:MAG: PEP-CTERM sorting domain-containing protein [Gemmatimonadaceae bacterium]|nr:PEP-CTERM sorting domain-containing protein [Gemmatimonadaceae bacterium]